MDLSERAHAWHRVTLAIAASVVSASCGRTLAPTAADAASTMLSGADGTGTDANGISAEASDAPGSSTLAAAFCVAERDQVAAWRARCYGGSATDWRASLDTLASCSDLDALVASGTARFHADLAAACLEATRADRDCGIDDLQCFTHVIEGTLAAGAPCKNDYACPYNAGCWGGGIDYGYNACRTSTCVHIPDRIGEACTDATGGRCFTGLTCVGGICQAEGAEGDSCAPDKPACGFALLCYGETCHRRSDGGDCHEDQDCIPTQYCTIDRVCLPRIIRGGACADAPNGCVSFAACSAGVCVPAGHVGQPCNAQVDFRNLCAEGVCLSGTCADPLQNGQQCFFGAQCASHGCNFGACAACAS
jgi:hypothetical protein